MDIFNMKEEAVRLLKEVPEIKKISTDYPANWTTFPMVIYRTIRTPWFIDAEKQELQSQWRIEIELYGEKKAGSLTEIANNILRAFNAVGFVGTSRESNTPIANRIIISVSGIIDNVTRFVYQK